MKKLLIIIVLFGLLAGCVKEKPEDHIPVDEFKSEIEIQHEQLESIVVKSKFPLEDQKQFEIELNELLKKEQLDESDIVAMARDYEYLGYPGKAIVIYEDYIIDNVPGYAIYNNLGSLYDSICKIEGEIYMDYCKKALEHYYYLVDTYKSSPHYKNITYLLVKMGEKERARKVYKLYLREGGQKDSVLENLTK